MPISFTVLNSAAWPCINDCAPPMISVVKFPEVGLLGEKAWYVLRAPKYLYCSYCSYCSWGSQGKNTEVACHSLLQWTTLCQTSPPWPAHLGLPCRLGFIELDKAVVLVWLDWLVFCDWSFHSSCPLMDKDKRLVESSWWEKLAMGEYGFCFDGQGHAQ